MGRFRERGFGLEYTEKMDEKVKMVNHNRWLAIVLTLLVLFVLEQ